MQARRLRGDAGELDGEAVAPAPAASLDLDHVPAPAGAATAAAPAPALAPLLEVDGGEELAWDPTGQKVDVPTGGSNPGGKVLPNKDCPFFTLRGC